MKPELEFAEKRWRPVDHPQPGRSGWEPEQTGRLDLEHVGVPDAED
jgi:hypothetical protein